MRVIRQTGTSYVSVRAKDTPTDAGDVVLSSLRARVTENDALAASVLTPDDTVLPEIHALLLTLERVALDPDSYPDVDVINRPPRAIPNHPARIWWISSQPKVKRLNLTREQIAGYLEAASLILERYAKLERIHP